MRYNIDMFIDAVFIKGETKSLTASINVMNEDETGFEPMNLTEYSIEFRVMGAPTADAEVLLSKIITQNTNIDVEGQITNAQEGQFTFTVTGEDTQTLGLGKFPIQLRLLNAENLEHIFTLTEGGLTSEFNAIEIVQV